MSHLTDAQREEAKNDQILADIALKQEQLRQMVSVKNDAMLADIRLKQEQLRVMKAFENWRFVLQVATAGAAIGGAFGVWLGIILH